MSGDEKQYQLAVAVQEYQADKIACAQIERKLGLICKNMHEIVQILAIGHEFEVRDGKLMVGYGDRKPSFDLLVNGEQLVSLVLERDLARARVVEGLSTLRSLGISNLE